MKIKGLIWHCTASPEGMFLSRKHLMSIFMAKPPSGNGWVKPGYRSVINIDGNVYDLINYNMSEDLEWDEVTYGAKGYNSEYIHLSYVGGVRKDDVNIAKDTRTFEQKKVMRAMTEYYLAYYPDIEIGGHNEVNDHKACPSFSVVRELAKWGIPEKNIGLTKKNLMITNEIDGSFDFDADARNKKFVLS